MGCSLETYRLRIGIHNLKSKQPKRYKKYKTDNNNHKKGKNRTVVIILILLTLIPNTHYNTQKQNNKNQHIKNGNNTIKMVQWNKGKANFNNKTNELDSILSKHRPNIISICKANINKGNSTETNNSYKDYKIEHTKMSINTNLSRNIIMIKEDIIYKRRTDLEDQETSTIWIEITIPKNNQS